MRDMAGKHVLVTGASRGVGAAAAKLLAENGATVSAISRSNGYDLSVVADIERAVSDSEEKHGPIDILINNAGFGKYEPFASSSKSDIRQTIDTNFTGLVLLTHHVVPRMIERRTGHLIHIASDLGHRPLANMAVYAATKHAVVGFSQSLARELRPFGIRSSVLLPGLIDSHFGGRNPGDVSQDVALTCEQVAHAVLYVASAPESLLIEELSLRSRGQDVP